VDERPGTGVQCTRQPQGHPSGISRWTRTYLDANPEVEEKLNQATQNIEAKKRFSRPISVKVDEDGKV
jgi:hypothetical protein